MYDNNPTKGHLLFFLTRRYLFAEHCCIIQLYGGRNLVLFVYQAYQDRIYFYILPYPRPCCQKAGFFECLEHEYWACNERWQIKEPDYKWLRMEIFC